MNNMVCFCVGFVFSDDYQKIALIRKNRPEWQVGKLNGIGGLIEEGETPIQAMCREFKEEAWYPLEDWQQFAVLEGEDRKLFFFKTTCDLDKLKQQTDEEIEVHFISDVFKENIIPNLIWLIPMALDKKVLDANIQIAKHGDHQRT